MSPFNFRLCHLRYLGFAFLYFRLTAYSLNRYSLGVPVGRQCFQFMEYLPAIREFGERIYAFHAKDTQILNDRRNQSGIYGDQFLQEPWWRFRMPGYGDADWKGIFVALSDVKYDGPMIIEHEDPTYEGEEGLRRGAKFLRQYIL